MLSNNDGAPPGNQAGNGENKPQPVALGETGLLDSNIFSQLNKNSIPVAIKEISEVL